MQSTDIIRPLKGELPGTYADRLGLQYTATVSQGHKKENGQFFTPPEIAHFMASLSDSHSQDVRILDPGCGTAILTCALIERLVASNPNLRSIQIVVYETDSDLLPFTNASLNHLETWLTERKVSLNYELKVTDFILDYGYVLNGTSALFENVAETFDIVICNPPYFKLSKDDLRTKAASAIVNGQPNIYAFFMAVSSRLLNPKGELIFITPRSFT